MFCLFIEIYWRVFQAILKYYWRVLNAILKNSNKYYFSKTIYFQLNREENGKYNSSSKNQLESEKISGGSSKKIEFHLETQSL